MTRKQKREYRELYKQIRYSTKRICRSFDDVAIAFMDLNLANGIASICSSILADADLTRVNDLK